MARRVRTDAPSSSDDAGLRRVQPEARVLLQVEVLAEYVRTLQAR